MESRELLRQLVTLGERCGFEVRIEPMETPGGACRVGGKAIIFLNEAADVADALDVMKAALADTDLSNVYVLPEVREFFEGGDDSRNGAS